MVSLTQQLVTLFGMADKVQNKAVAGAEAVRTFTFEQYIGQDSALGARILDVLNLKGRTPSPESLQTRMDLSGQVERTVASFGADDRPENAAAIITIGSNDFLSFLSPNIAFIGEIARALGSLASSGPLDIPALIADPATPEPLRQFFIEIATVLTGTIAATVWAVDAFVEAGIDTMIFATNPSFSTPFV